MLQTRWVGDREDYLFYLGYIQIHLGWTEEAYQTLTKLQMEFPDSEQAGTVAGFLADIFHHEGQLGNALQEISKALQIEPDCPLIQKKAQEIVDDFNQLFSGLVILACLQARKFKADSVI